MRSRVGVALVVLVLAGASSTAAAGSPAPESAPSAPSATASIVNPATAFALPVPSTPAAPTAHHVAARHHHRHPRERHVSRPAPLPPCPGTTTSPHFDTPAAAMRYLARAWNHDDYDDLCHVTGPDARRLLVDMHSEAVHLRFARCEYATVGRYGCTFRHDYPRHLHQRGVGHAYLEVAAARTPGWYSTGAIGCG